MKIRSKEDAQLKIAILCKQIINCKWYQFFKRAAIYREAKKIAKDWDIEF